MLFFRVGSQSSHPPSRVDVLAACRVGTCAGAVMVTANAVVRTREDTNFTNNYALNDGGVFLDVLNMYISMYCAVSRRCCNSSRKLTATGGQVVSPL